MSATPVPDDPAYSPDHLARHVLLAFTTTFALSRAVVFLIMSGRIPNMFLFLHGTHVHHLNYGIFLLSAVGGYAVVRRPAGAAAGRAALVYGVALALTFDEFGMWLHLGGSYWQRASVDAVVVLTSVLILIAYVPSFEHLSAHHRTASVLLAFAIVAFAAVVWIAGNRIGHLVGPRLVELESASSP
jgi:hypothetical protein